MVGAGISLMIVGAVLAFAVRRETPGVDVQTVGVILLVAGALVIAHARRGTLRERTVTRVEDPLAGERAQTHHISPAADPLTAGGDPLSPVTDPVMPHPAEDPAPPLAQPSRTNPSRRTVREQVTDRELP